jgi:ion channel-forming bestrophin family protein
MAWLTALRYKLREEKPWENLHESGNKQFMNACYTIPEREVPLETSLAPLLSEKEFKTFIARRNDPLYCLELQQNIIEQLHKEKQIDKECFVTARYIIDQLITKQTNCIRIKENPFPRNFYSMTKIFLKIFLIALPFSILSELPDTETIFHVIPLTIVIGWVFICLEKVGQNTSNPFEGGVNDVPITTISRQIEITLKTTGGFSEIPKPIEPMSGRILL